MPATTDMAMHVPEPPPTPPSSGKFDYIRMWRKLTGKDSASSPSPVKGSGSISSRDVSPTTGLIRRMGRKVVPGLPRAKTWRRQQSEGRERLEADKQTPAERRAVSVDRRMHPQRTVSHEDHPLPTASAPAFILGSTPPPSTSEPLPVQSLSAPQPPADGILPTSTPDIVNLALDPPQPELSEAGPPPSEDPEEHGFDDRSDTTSVYEGRILDELERIWILNLSMHFRDKSKREKFFVTYREHESLWRRVTISLDYRNAPEDSLERDLLQTRYQREKSRKIYEAIRDSLQDIQFYDTVTNLKLQTTDGRLHVHVVEDVNEIIQYPQLHALQHTRCRRVKERDIEFDSHMSGFVYKVRHNGQVLIKKEIPGPDTVEEFLYEVNALNALQFSRTVIDFYGVVVDDMGNVKGLLISYADRGALIDIIYDSQEHDMGLLPWTTRIKWAWQIVQGLADVHESGFVQGDFTLSNIVIDEFDNARIIDINRRGCPVGWEPPEAVPLIESNQRISMYIGVKSDLYQLGMVLWALATLEDEPEAHHRPLRLSREIEAPEWYRTIVGSCLSDDPRLRLQASQLLGLFPETAYDGHVLDPDMPSISVDDGHGLRQYMVDETRSDDGQAHFRSLRPNAGWPYAPFNNTRPASPTWSDDYSYEPRGRSPPSPLPSHHGVFDNPRDAWYNQRAGPSAPGRGDGKEHGQVGIPAEIEIPLGDAAKDPMGQELDDMMAANLHRDSAVELNRSTGGDSQTEKATPSADEDVAFNGTMKKGVGAETPLSSQNHDQQAGALSGDEARSGAPVTLAAQDKDLSKFQEAHTADKTVPSGEQQHNKKNEGTGAEIQGPTHLGEPKQQAEARHYENDSHDRNDNDIEQGNDQIPKETNRHAMPTRNSAMPIAETESPAREGTRLQQVPSELAGIGGAAYEVVSGKSSGGLPRKMACSDEDLGLVTTPPNATTPPSRGVTSWA